MTLLHVKLARAIWLVDSRDLNPRGIDILPILAAVQERYNFEVYPKTVQEANENDPKGIVFMNGSFAVDSHRYAIAKATMFGDGLVVDSVVSTDFSEAVLGDLLLYLSSEFSLTYSPDMIHKRIYVSEMIVHMEKDLRKVFASISVLREKLNLLTGHNFEPTGFGLSVDPHASESRPSTFRFECETNKPFSQKRYYSGAPMKTSQHEELLRALEILL